jgi:hypothetical protein
VVGSTLTSTSAAVAGWWSSSAADGPRELGEGAHRPVDDVLG